MKKKIKESDCVVTGRTAYVSASRLTNLVSSAVGGTFQLFSVQKYAIFPSKLFQTVACNVCFGSVATFSTPSFAGAHERQHASRSFLKLTYHLCARRRRRCLVDYSLQRVKSYRNVQESHLNFFPMGRKCGNINF